MKRNDYKINKWYPITEENYWVEDYPDEFPDCMTIICFFINGERFIYTYRDCPYGWNVLYKSGTAKLMIVELPVED